MGIVLNHNHDTAFRAILDMMQHAGDRTGGSTLVGLLRW